MKKIIGIETWSQKDKRSEGDTVTNIRIHYTEEFQELTPEALAKDPYLFKDGVSVNSVYCRLVDGLKGLKVGQEFSDFAYSRHEYFDKSENKMKDFYSVIGILPVIK